jgi:anti-sigma regulatory factor (Ser/Thr protein kinase)
LAALSHLDGRVGEQLAGDVGLIVSELVTNSVRHAAVGAAQEIQLEIALLPDRVRIVVTDPGSRLVPRVAEREPGSPGCFSSSSCRRPGAWRATSSA